MDRDSRHTTKRALIWIKNPDITKLKSADMDQDSRHITKIKSANMDQDSRHITKNCDVMQGFGVYIANHLSQSKLQYVVIILLGHLTLVHLPNYS